jgi:hypothetical protein
MRLSTLPRYAILIAAGTLLSGCGGLPTSGAVPPESPQMRLNARREGGSYAKRYEP